MSNYPPGVTGNEPQISGVWPVEDLADHVAAELRGIERKLEDLQCVIDDQGGPQDLLDALEDLHKRAAAAGEREWWQLEPDYETMEEERMMRRNEPSGDVW